MRAVQRESLSVNKVGAPVCNIPVLNDDKICQLVDDMMYNFYWINAQENEVWKSIRSIIQKGTVQHMKECSECLDIALKEVGKSSCTACSRAWTHVAPSCIIRTLGNEGILHVTAFAGAAASFPSLDIIRLRRADGVRISNQCVHAFLSQCGFTSNRCIVCGNCAIRWRFSMTFWVFFLRIFLNFNCAGRSDTEIWHEQMKLPGMGEDVLVRKSKHSEMD